MKFEQTSARLWRRLTREERLAAATSFFREPPRELAGTALAAIVKARRLRPQVARALTAEQQASHLAGVLDPGELLSSSLLVALHLGSRRPMLATFLDAAGLAHEDGILKDEGPDEPVTADEARKGVEALRAVNSAHEVETYLNTLWLQDPDRWTALTTIE